MAELPVITITNESKNGLTAIIYPSMSKVMNIIFKFVNNKNIMNNYLQILKQHQDEETIIGLAQLKYAFDNIEKVQPGLSQTFIMLMIEQLKQSS